jgi:hypothetical protein
MDYCLFYLLLRGTSILMKKIKKIAISMAMALSLGISFQASALIELESNGYGDTLLFPVFYGYGENYFTISNSSNDWVQGHLRFRGAVWCGELLDLDIILSPGDVFVFRLADIDGDGYWEIDQSLDPKNFQYTGMLANCSPESGSGTGQENCRDQSSILIPQPDNSESPPGNITADRIKHHRNMGQVEFIGEGVLLPRSTLSARMSSFIDSENAGKLANLGQRQATTKLGTHLWSWVSAYEAYPNCDTTYPGGQACKDGLFEHEDTASDITIHARDENRYAGDVGNVLSGTAFLTKTGDSAGLAYNAEALANFRTSLHGNGSHRVENYSTAVGGSDNAVILHHEDSIAGGNPGNYAYAYAYEEHSSNVIQNFEARISFNNTWGPTLADGDDYNTTTTDGQWLNGFVYFVDTNSDVWDDTFSQHPNSLAEVNEAVRTARSDAVRQSFSSFYMDGAEFDKSGSSSATLTSWYFAFAPTKFFSGEHHNLWRDSYRADIDAGWQRNDRLLGKSSYLTAAVNHLINAGKEVNLQVWDIFENTPQFTQECDVSPCLAGETIRSSMVIVDQVAAFSIDDVKNTFGSGSHKSWDAGRVVMTVNSVENEWCHGSISVLCPQNYPLMLYTFDWSSDGTLSHWRPMQK